jgi:hypothetical protein
MKITKLTLLDLNSGFLRKNPAASACVRRPLNNSSVDSTLFNSDQDGPEPSNLFLNAMTVIALLGVTILCYRAYKGYKERDEGKKTL